jgi:hypothetical protein
MTYLEIIERLKHGAQITPGTEVVHDPSYEINEKNEISSPATPESPKVAGGELARCGSANCAGCYSVGEIDGRERFVHPPRPSPEWLVWRAKWDIAKWRPPKGSRTQ